MMVIWMIQDTVIDSTFDVLPNGKTRNEHVLRGLKRTLWMVPVTCVAAKDLNSTGDPALARAVQIDLFCMLVSHLFPFFFRNFLSNFHIFASSEFSKLIHYFYFNYETSFTLLPTYLHASLAFLIMETFYMFSSEGGRENHSSPLTQKMLLGMFFHSMHVNMFLNLCSAI